MKLVLFHEVGPSQNDAVAFCYEVGAFCLLVGLRHAGRTHTCIQARVSLSVV